MHAYIIGNRGVVDPRLLNYLGLYSKAKQYDSVIKASRHEVPSVIGEIERKIESLKKKPAKKRGQIVGLSAEEKHLLDTIRRYKPRRRNN